MRNIKRGMIIVIALVCLLGVGLPKVDFEKGTGKKVSFCDTAEARIRSSSSRGGRSSTSFAIRIGSGHHHHNYYDDDNNLSVMSIAIIISILILIYMIKKRVQD